ncbi:hypothetical protein LCGC14_2642230 [marine sediment metagenome]|uniref:Uncharacterized protein n=1 Tax=marine sediment metagenome TaxID=412755 RepID=A0A0F9AJL8_9ZZZZ
MSRAIILKEIDLERERQEGFWGSDFDDLNTPNDWVTSIVHYVVEGAYDGRSMFYTPENFREHLVKAATITVAAIEALDRNGKLAPRHYDRG